MHILKVPKIRTTAPVVSKQQAADDMELRQVLSSRRESCESPYPFLPRLEPNSRRLCNSSSLSKLDRWGGARWGCQVSRCEGRLCCCRCRCCFLLLLMPLLSWAALYRFVTLNATVSSPSISLSLFLPCCFKTQFVQISQSEMLLIFFNLENLD